MKLLRPFARKSYSPPAFLDDRVGYAIGDVHGRLDLLVELLTVLEARLSDEMRESGPPIAVFLGDYVDRGPESAGVIDLVLNGAPRGYERRFLMGNHEQSMLAFMEAPLQSRPWVLQGGAETLLSYGVQPPATVAASESDWIAVAQALRAKLPAAHHNFLRGLERYAALGGFAFVHAGVDHARTLEQQTDDDLFWSRERFLASRKRFSHVVVHGHTPAERPYMDERRIGLDTGAYASGMLTAARFEGSDVSFLSVTDSGGRRTVAG
jgi:serine/threonine protein phosphatase 1